MKSKTKEIIKESVKMDVAMSFFFMVIEFSYVMVAIGPEHMPINWLTFFLLNFIAAFITIPIIVGAALLIFKLFFNI